MASRNHVHRAIELYEDELARYPNVTGIGVVPVTDDPDGPTNLAVAVYVTRKVPRDELKAGERIPPTLEIPSRDGAQGPFRRGSSRLGSSPSRISSTSSLHSHRGRRAVMPDGNEDVDKDTPVSSFDAAEESISDEISTGEDEQVEKTPRSGFEKVEGYKAPTAPSHSQFSPEAVGEVLSVPDETTQLPDIGEASFGPPDALAETVHGADDRFQITNTAAYPWRAHASLRITAADNSVWIGTGWFVGPRLLVTAGHVVYIKNSGVAGRDGWVQKIVVMPGRNGGTLPFGSATTSNFWSVVGWATDGDGEYDYGAIVLGESLGDRTGWLGFGNWPSLDGVHANISGYPGDKPAAPSGMPPGRSTPPAPARCSTTSIPPAARVDHAVYRFANGSRYGIAIHAYGGATVNSGTRISQPVFNNIKAWKEASQA